MEGIIKQLIEEYRKLEEVEAITIAGSRAANRSDEQSDIDIDCLLLHPFQLKNAETLQRSFHLTWKLIIDFSERGTSSFEGLSY